MITSIYFDDVIVVKQGKNHGSVRSDLRETSFHSPEWEIRETLVGVFTLWTEGMDVPQTVGGYGYSYSSTRDAEGDVELPKRKGKR